MKGFTLIELLAALTIIALLSGIGLPLYDAFLSRNDDSQVFVDESMIRFEIDKYESASFRLPDSLKDIGMQDLLDPWGNGYVYRKTDEESYELYSLGADGTTKITLEMRNG